MSNSTEPTYAAYRRWISNLRQQIDPYTQQEWQQMDAAQKHLIGLAIRRT